MKENDTFRRDIDDIYSDFIKVQSLFELITNEMNSTGVPTSQGVDALSGATNYLSRVMDDFAAIVDPVPVCVKEVPA